MCIYPFSPVSGNIFPQMLDRRCQIFKCSGEPVRENPIFLVAMCPVEQGYLVYDSHAGYPSTDKLISNLPRAGIQP
jgi:hypothetical protein